MSNSEKEPEVKDIERVEIAPAEDDDENVETPDSSQEETDEEGDEDKDEPESEETDESDEDDEETEKAPTKVAPKTLDKEPDEDTGEIKRLEGETPKEFAYRLEITRLRRESRKERSGEIITPPPAASKKELSPEKKKVLEKYKPEDIQTLKEVFDVMADDMGFVKKDELGATTFQEKAAETLDTFLEKHPEYLPQNDPDNVLWGRFKEEFNLYRPATNTKELRKILDKVHKDVFGIKPATAIDKKEAAKEKVKVASHGGPSRPAPSREGVKRNTAPQGLRTDMLKGFSDEELEELTQG